MNKEEKSFKIKFLILKISFNIIVISLICVIAICFGKYIETFILFISYLLLRYKFPKTYHSYRLTSCLLWSWCLFFLLIKEVLSINLSILSGVILALLSTFILFKIKCYIDLVKFKNDFSLEQINSLSNLSLEQVNYICDKLGYSKNKRNLAVKFLVDKLSNEEVFNYLEEQKLNIQMDSVKHYKYIIKRDFNKFIKIK